MAESQTPSWPTPACSVCSAQDGKCVPLLPQQIGKDNFVSRSLGRGVVLCRIGSLLSRMSYSVQ